MKLSFHQIELLAHYARHNYGKCYEVHRFKPHIARRSVRALKDKNLLIFNPLFGTYTPTSHGERALIEHGYSVKGEWQGSNQPRKYR